MLWNLVRNPFGGAVFPINPQRPSVLGIKAYPTLADVPAKIDLAVIVTPAAAVPALVGQCADLQIPAAVIISTLVAGSLMGFAGALLALPIAATTKVIIYEAFVEGKLEAPKHLARNVHDLYFEPQYEEFRPRTIWSLSNAFTSAFKELDPIPQFRATAKLGEFLEARFSQTF